MAPNPNLQRLREAGVSIWLDTLSRELLDSGGFAELIRDYGVTGATSNPTIFAKAIADSARLGLASCRKVTRTRNIRFWRVPGPDGTRRDVRRWPWC